MRVACFLLVPALLCAQGNLGGIRGQVTDPSGSVVPEATVTVFAGCGAARTAKTDLQGQYQFANLASVAYTVRAAAKGFASGQLNIHLVLAGCRFGPPVQHHSGPRLEWWHAVHRSPVLRPRRRIRLES